jgi:hypothetical protein
MMPEPSSDGRTITVQVPLAIRERGERRQVVTLPGRRLGHHDPKVDSTLVKALARAFRNPTFSIRFMFRRPIRPSSAPVFPWPSLTQLPIGTQVSRVGCPPQLSRIHADNPSEAILSTRSSPSRYSRNLSRFHTTGRERQRPERSRQVHASIIGAAEPRSRW